MSTTTTTKPLFIESRVTVDGISNRDFLLIDVSEEAVLASCTVQHWDRPGATISWVHTPEWCRRQGHARNLIEHVLFLLEANGKTGVILNVQKDNEAAQALYHKLGFRIVGVEYHYPDTLLMARFFNATPAQP